MPAGVITMLPVGRAVPWDLSSASHTHIDRAGQHGGVLDRGVSVSRQLIVGGELHAERERNGLVQPALDQ